MAEANGSYEYDLVTIGAGSGGVRASRMAAGTYGAKVSMGRARDRSSYDEKS